MSNLPKGRQTDAFRNAAGMPSYPSTIPVTREPRLETRRQTGVAVTMEITAACADNGSTREGHDVDVDIQLAPEIPNAT
jgi:hypothetical protein